MFCIRERIIISFLHYDFLHKNIFLTKNFLCCELHYRNSRWPLARNYETFNQTRFGRSWNKWEAGEGAEKTNKATREIFFLSSVWWSGTRDDSERNEKEYLSLSAIIISTALPVIAIVLTNAQIAFQIVPPWENRARCQGCPLFNTDEKERGGATHCRTIKRDRTSEIKRKGEKRFRLPAVQDSPS